MFPSKLHDGLFVCGVTFGLLCLAAAAMKLLRLELSPATIFYVLAIPPLWFYGRSEYHDQCGEYAENARDAATVLLLALLACYLIPSLLRLLMFPDYTPVFFHYFQHAPAALVIGLLLIRLHAFGGGASLVFSGILTAMTASFFLTARLIFRLFGGSTPPPTGNLLELFAFIAIALSYGMLITTQANGLLKKALAGLGRLDEPLWQAVRRFLFPVLLGACHLLFFLRLAFPTHQERVSLLLPLLAGLWVYTGVTFRNLFCYSVGYVEIVAMIFSCRWFWAFWPETWISRLLLALFILLIPIYSRWLKPRYRFAATHFYLWLITLAGLMISEHFTFCGAYSRSGILLLSGLWLAALFIPVEPAIRANPEFTGLLAALLYVPAFLFLLLKRMFVIEALPGAALTFVTLAGLVIAYRSSQFQWLSEEGVREFRLVHHAHWYITQPHAFLPVFLFATLTALGALGLIYSDGYAPFAGQFLPLLILQGILLVYWWNQAKTAFAWWWTLLAELMVSGIVFTLRQGVQYSLDMRWTPMHDMLIGWFAAVSITALRPILKRQAQAVRLPIRFTLFGLPLITSMYAVKFSVDLNALTIMTSLYGIIFLWDAHTERDRLVLAYAFVWLNASMLLVLFQNDIHSLPAYVTPVCVSILVLVQFFRDITTRGTANFVRGAALTLMFGVALFQSVIESALSPAAHLVVISLSILTLTAAVLLRIRIFAAAGLFGFVIDLLAILYLVLSRQDTETFRVMLGGLFTVGGGLILGGFIFYLKHKAQIKAMLERMKRILASWE